ncbi:MAG: TIGR03013 family PEP-CTERM/XrtA system glycosyltransferase [Candidatus Competibacteraceae bacterium]
MSSTTFRIMQHDIPKNLIVLAIIEMAVLGLSILFGIKIYLTTISAAQEPYYIFLIATLYSLVIFCSLLAVGWHWYHTKDGTLGRLLRLIVGYFLGNLIFFFFARFVPDISFDKNLFLFTTLIGLCGILFVHFVYNLIMRQDVSQRKIIVLGAGERASQLAEIGWSNIKIVGYVPYAENPVRVDEKSLLPPSSSLWKIAKSNNVKEIVVALDERRKNLPLQELLECKLAGLKIVELVPFFESHLGKIKIGDLVPSTIIFSDGFRKTKFRDFSKRLFDIFISSLLLIITIPVILLTTFVIFLDSGYKGPILYHQIRVGRGNKNFTIMKFRTMRVDAEKEGVAQWADRNDPRVTKIGKMLRKFRVDELPQLINVIKGEMSFVGPRPERPEFIKELEKDIPYYTLRHTVKPGITGWAQISYPYGASIEDAKEKLQYDLYYIKNYSMFFDLYILLQTVHTVLGGRGGR